MTRRDHSALSSLSTSSRNLRPPKFLRGTTTEKAAFRRTAVLVRYLTHSACTSPSQRCVLTVRSTDHARVYTYNRSLRRKCQVLTWICSRSVKARVKNQRSTFLAVHGYPQRIPGQYVGCADSMRTHQRLDNNNNALRRGATTNYYHIQGDIDHKTTEMDLIYGTPAGQQTRQVSRIQGNASATTVLDSLPRRNSKARSENELQRITKPCLPWSTSVSIPRDLHKTNRRTCVC